MSGKFDKFVIKLGFVKEEDVKKLYKIRLCRDRTITFTKGKEKPFNKVAIAVFSVDTINQARDLITFVGTKQYENHPTTNKVWYKFMPLMEYKLLEFEDLPRLANYLKDSFETMSKHRKEFESRLEAHV